MTWLKSCLNGLVSNRKHTIDIAALIIAACALAVSAWQIPETRRHNRLAIRPAITLEVDTSGEERVPFFGIVMRNHGLGTAVIQSIEISASGRTARTREEWVRLHEEEFIADDLEQFPGAKFVGWMEKGDMLAQDREFRLLGYENSQQKPGRPGWTKPLQEAIDKLDIRVKYTGLLGGEVYIATQHHP